MNSSWAAWAEEASLGSNRTYPYLGVLKWSPVLGWDLSRFGPIAAQYFYVPSENRTPFLKMSLTTHPSKDSFLKMSMTTHPVKDSVLNIGPWLIKNVDNMI